MLQSSPLPLFEYLCPNYIWNSSVTKWKQKMYLRKDKNTGFKNKEILSKTLSAFFLALLYGWSASHFHLRPGLLGKARGGWAFSPGTPEGVGLWPSGGGARKVRTQILVCRMGEHSQGQCGEWSKIRELFWTGALLNQVSWVSLQAMQMSTQKRTNGCTNGVINNLRKYMWPKFRIKVMGKMAYSNLWWSRCKCDVKTASKL